MYHIPCKQTEQKEDAAVSLGSNLFNARKESGLSQEETAGKLGVSRQTISKWELNALLVLKDMLAAVWRRRKTGARRGD